MIRVLSNDDVEADRAAWLAIRRGGITATDIGCIMGIKSAHRGAAAIYWSKVRGDELGDRMQFRMGRHWESFAADELALERPDIRITDGGLYRHDDRPWQLATFDRLGVEPAACTCGRESVAHLAVAHDTGCPWPGALFPVQIKTTQTDDGWGDPPDGDIPAHYLAQVLWEMSVSGADHALLPCLRIPNGPMWVYRIFMDANAEADLAVMIDEAEKMRGRITRGDPPPVDWRPDTTDTLRRIYAETVELVETIPDRLGERLIAAKYGRYGVDEAKRRLAQAENEVRAILGVATTAALADGTVVAKRSVYPNRRVSVSLLRREHPDIAAAMTVVADKQIDKLLVKQPKERNGGNG